MEQRSAQRVTTATDLDDSWTHIRDKSQRKRIQNRVAQRTYRQRFKNRIEALERWRDAAKSSTTAPLIPTNTQFPATEAESRAEQMAASNAFPIPPPNRTHSLNSSLPLMDPDTPPEGNNALVPHHGVQESTLTPTSLSNSSFLHQEPDGSNSYPYDPDGTTLPMWDSNDDDMHAAYDATVSDFQSSVQHGKILSRSPPIHPINEQFSPPSTVFSGPKAGKSVLHLAAENGHRTSVLRLLELDIHVHSQDRAGRTALHLAIQNSHEEVVHLLLSTLQNFRNRNAELRWTAEQLTALVNTQDESGQTALHMAAAGREDAIVEMLLRTDIDLELKDNNGYKALHLAGLHGSDSIVELLVNRGADINSTTG